MTNTDTPPAADDAEDKRDPLPCWVPEFRSVLALLSTLLLAGAFAASYELARGQVKLDAGIMQSLGQIQGAIILQWGLVMGYYFGTTKGSVAKDATIAAQARAADTTGK